MEELLVYKLFVIATTARNRNEFAEQKSSFLFTEYHINCPCVLLQIFGRSCI